MPAENEMTIDERRKYLTKMKTRYQKAKREDRGRLLSEMVEITGMHRKSLTRLMQKASLARKKRQTARARTYGLDVETIVIRVWESLDYVCAERLTPVLEETARHLARFGEVRVSDAQLGQVGRISRATVSRMLRKYRSQRRRLPQKGAERANQATKGVPMGRIAWDVSEAGHCEVDLVHHSGESSSGEYGHTLQMVDVLTGWSERVVVRGRGYEAMKGGFERILERVPFAIKELHPDNGSEFFNQHLRRFWGEKVPEMTLSRSRPYQKNDNRHVEQKNDTLVRQYVGEMRLDTPEQLEALSTLYERMWVYYNLFQPVMHLAEKEVVADHVRRRWDEAQTPFARLKASGGLSVEHEQRLQALYDQTNPRALHDEIYRRLTALYDLAPVSQSPTSALDRKEKAISV